MLNKINDFKTVKNLVSGKTFYYLNGIRVSREKYDLTYIRNGEKFSFYGNTKGGFTRNGFSGRTTKF